MGSLVVDLSFLVSRGGMRPCTNYLVISLRTKPSVTLLGLCTLHGLGARGMELGI